MSVIFCSTDSCDAPAFFVVGATSVNCHENNNIVMMIYHPFVGILKYHFNSPFQYYLPQRQLEIT